MMAKVEVNGDGAHPVYKVGCSSADSDIIRRHRNFSLQYLKSERKQMMMEVIKWNFEKFLVDKTGNVVERFSSAGDPMSHIAPQVEKLL